MNMQNDFEGPYPYYQQYNQPTSYKEGSAGMMNGMMMQPNIMPHPMYNQGPYPMSYYTPMPMNQNMMPSPGMMQPGVYNYGYSPQMHHDSNMNSPPGYNPHVLQSAPMPMHGQPVYPMYYPQQNQAPHGGQYNQY